MGCSSAPVSMLPMNAKIEVKTPLLRLIINYCLFAVKICDRVRPPDECVTVRATRCDPEFIPGINNQPWNDRVGQRPKRRSESGSRLIEPRVAIEFACKLQSAVDKARKRQIELLIFVESSRLPDQKFGGIEIEMDCMNVFAGQKGERVVGAARSQAILAAGRWDLLQHS
jgi:hypothetical protein